MAAGIYVLIAIIGLIFAVVSILGYFTDHKTQD